MTEPAIYFDTDHADDRAFADDLDLWAYDRGVSRWPGESDQEFRERIASGLFPVRGTREAIERALLRIPGVHHVDVTEEHDARADTRVVIRVDVALESRLELRNVIMLEIDRHISASVTWVLELECSERDRALDYDGIGDYRDRWGRR